MYSCAGYRFKNNDNPFAQYGIKRVTIPLFVNRSVFGNISGSFTRDINLLLGQYNDLKVYGGKTARADGVLLGIVSSDNRMRDVVKTTDRVFTENQVGNSLTNEQGVKRPDFYIPRTGIVTLTLNLILIKRPTAKEIELMRSDISGILLKHPKVIFNKTFKVTTTFTRELNGTESVDDSGVVNATKNKQVLISALDRLSLQASRMFREEVLDAF